jgi:hypothetical protein
MSTRTETGDRPCAVTSFAIAARPLSESAHRRKAPPCMTEKRRKFSRIPLVSLLHRQQSGPREEAATVRTCSPDSVSVDFHKVALSFLELVRPYVKDIEEMRHYRVIGEGRKRSTPNAA